MRESTNEELVKVSIQTIKDNVPEDEFMGIMFEALTEEYQDVLLVCGYTDEKLGTYNVNGNISKDIRSALEATEVVLTEVLMDLHSQEQEEDEQ